MKALAIALALLDFAPVFFLGLGLFFLAQLVDRLDHRCRRMAVWGIALVTLGGLARAVSNLTAAVSGGEIPLLTTSFYVFVGPGFIVMAGALIRARATSRGKVIARDPWILPTVIWWGFLLFAFYVSTSNEAGGEWRRVLLLLALMGSASTCIATAALGWARQLHMAAGLLAFNVAATSTLFLLSLLSPDGLWIQLLEVLLHIGAQAAFAFASWRVAAEYHARVGPTAAP